MLKLELERIRTGELESLPASEVSCERARYVERITGEPIGVKKRAYLARGSLLKQHKVNTSCNGGQEDEGKVQGRCKNEARKGEKRIHGT